MMLSIRTQDRMALVPYNSRIEVIRPVEKMHTIIINYGDTYKSKRLGTYATKERALEVLDEIQQHVIGKMFISENVPRYNFDDYSPVYILEENEQLINLPIVYQMPIE